MADTIREKIIQAIEAKIAGLSTLPIGRCQRSIGENAAKFVSLWDGEDRLEQSQYGIQTLQFTLAVECIWPYGSDNPSVAANAVMGNIISTMLSGDLTYGGLAEDTQYQAASPRYPDDGSNYVTVTVFFTISYSIAAGNPYANP